MPAIITRGAASAQGFGFAGKTAVAPGSQSYTTPGTYTWVAPAGVKNVSVVAVGGGGRRTFCGGRSGAGGGLGYKNNISVTSGNSYTVVVGAGASSTISAVGCSYFISTATVKGGGGSVCCTTGGTFVGDGGGCGGIANCSGGGAGGYSGAGGAGRSGYGVGNSGAGGGGGSGGIGIYNGYQNRGAGGGVGIFGAGANGAGGVGGVGTFGGGWLWWLWWRSRYFRQYYPRLRFFVRSKYTRRQLWRGIWFGKKCL